MKKLNLTIAFTLGLWGQGPLLADTFLYPGEAGSHFLVMPISARTVALGSGLSGLAGDIAGFECNPAVLPTMRDHQITFTRAQLYQDTNLTSFAMAMKAHKSFGFGFQYRRFGVTDTGRETSGFETGEDIKVFDNGFQIGFGYGFLDGKVSAGYSIEYLRRFIYRYTAISYAHNFGIQLDLYKGKHVIGAAIQNAGEPITFISANEPLPLVVRIGGSHRLGEREIETFEEGAILAEPLITGVWEINQFRDQRRPTGSVGSEWRLFEHFGFRGGLEWRQQVHITGGLGFQWKSLNLDYAVANRLEVGLAHTLSLMVRWSDIEFDLGGDDD